MESPRTLLFVHAHPDDESLWSGVAIAQHVLAGDTVHVLTCTLGEEGEVIPAATRRFELAPDAPREGAAGGELAGLRAHELGAAVATLGARGVMLSDLVGRSVRDSGMAGSPASRHADAFVAAPLHELAEGVAAFIDEEAVDEVVSYERNGGYGHPDHIRAHQLACAAARASRRRPSLWGIVLPREWALEDRQWLATHVDDPAAVVPPADAQLPLNLVAAVPERVYDLPAAAARQAEALSYHRTQVIVRDGWYMLSNMIATRLAGREALAPMDLSTGEVIDSAAGGAR
jgi:N-acetyl-1-D-myo-inositol-2-amino-2-deoxy-alpha-D-glucopyranoside deacetylase